MNTVLLAKKMNLTKEMYLAIMLDRASMGDPNPNPNPNPDPNPNPVPGDHARPRVHG